jgi:hypothetical protein
MALIGYRILSMTTVVLRCALQLILEIGSSNMIPFLDILISWKRSVLTTPVYRKLTNIGCYLSYQSNHPPQVKQGVAEGFIIEPKPYVKITKSYMKFITSNMIFAIVTLPRICSVHYPTLPFKIRKSCMVPDLHFM